MNNIDLVHFLMEYISGASGHIQTQAEIFITDYRNGEADLQQHQKIVAEILRFIDDGLDKQPMDYVKALLQFLQASGLVSANREIKNSLQGCLSRAINTGIPQPEFMLLLGSFIFSILPASSFPGHEIANSLQYQTRLSFMKSPTWGTWQLLANIAGSKLLRNYQPSDAISDLKKLYISDNTRFPRRLQDRNSLLKKLGTDYIDVLAGFKRNPDAGNFASSGFRSLVNGKRDECWHPTPVN